MEEDEGSLRRTRRTVKGNSRKEEKKKFVDFYQTWKTKESDFFFTFTYFWTKSLMETFWGEVKLS